jgi:hypothetical protein
VPETYPVKITAFGIGGTRTRTVNVTVNPATAAMAPVATRSGKPFATTVSETMAAAGTWSASAGPADVAGLAVSGSTLSGTAPAISGATAATRTLLAVHTGPAVTAGSRASVAASATLTVHPTLSIGTPTAKSGFVGTLVSFAPPGVVGGVGTVTYGLFSGAADVSSTLSTLCPGLSFNQATGAIRGTPTGTCAPSLAYRAYDDGNGNPALVAGAASTAFTLAIAAPSIAATPSSVTVTEGDRISLLVTSSIDNATWTVSGNPPWMSFGTAFTPSGFGHYSGSVSGDVTAPTTYAVVVTATNGPATVSKTINVTVNPASATLASVAVRGGGAFGTAVSETMAAAGTWNASADPSDVTNLAVTGTTLAGIAPPNAGTSAFARTLTATHTGPAVTGGAPASASATGTLTVHPGLLVADPADRSGTTGSALLAAAPGVTGAAGSLTFGLFSADTDVSATLGATCPGLGFSAATGAISGTPTATCSTVLSYAAYDDGAGNPALAASARSSTFTLAVTPGGATASVASATATEGDTVAFSVSTTLDNPTWSVSGQPAWMAFSASGKTYATSSVSGDVSDRATYPVTVTATAGSVATSSRVEVTVTPATASMAPASVRSDATFSAALSETMQAAGTWSSAPTQGDVTGLAVSGNALGGKAPANAGTAAFNRTLSATHTGPAVSAGTRAAALAEGILTVHPGLSVAAPLARSGPAGVPMPFAAPAVTGAAGSLAYALMSGTTDVSSTLGGICPGLSFDRASGNVAGTPS